MAFMSLVQQVGYGIRSRAYLKLPYQPRLIDFRDVEAVVDGLVQITAIRRLDMPSIPVGTKHRAAVMLMRRRQF